MLIFICIYFFFIYIFIPYKLSRKGIYLKKKKNLDKGNVNTISPQYQKTKLEKELLCFLQINYILEREVCISLSTYCTKWLHYIFLSDDSSAITTIHWLYVFVKSYFLSRYMPIIRTGSSKFFLFRFKELD